MLNQKLLLFLTNVMIYVWLKHKLVSWYYICLIIVRCLVITKNSFLWISLWQLHNNVGKVCINSGYQILCLMIMVMRIYSSLRYIFSIQSAGFLLLFLTELPFLHTKVKHHVFVYIKKINYWLRLGVVVNIAANIFPESINKIISISRWVIKRKAYMHQIQNICIIKT